MSEKKLFLLDGMALIYRAFFAFSKNPRLTSYGLNTGAMFGFTNTLLDVLNNQKPSHIAVVFDTAAPTERHMVFEDYKAQREEMPEDLSKAIPYIFKIIEAFNIPVITMDGYEADDIIGTMALKASAKGYETYMMTPDKDYGQLVRDNVYIYKPAHLGNGAEVLGVNEILKKWEIDNVSQVIDILGLWGDAVDNIPGIPGVGEKTAKKLIKEYGSMENMLANKEQLKGSLKEKVIQFEKQALLSKQLATINIDVPIDLNEASLILEPVNRELLEPLFKELEFRNLATRVFGSDPSSSKGQPDLFSSASAAASNGYGESQPQEDHHFNTIENTPHSYTLISNEEELKNILPEFVNASEFCFDTETTGLDSIEASVLGIALSAKPATGYYIALTNENRERLLGLLKPLLEGPGMKIAQNLKYDIQVLQNHGITVKPPYYDTMLAHYLIEPDKRHNMDILSQQYLHYEPVSIESLIGKKGKNQMSMAEVDLEKVKEYAAEDADITFQLKAKMNPLVIEHGADKVLANIEIPLVPVLAEMEREGVRIDTSFLDRYSVEIANELIGIEKAIYDMAGVQFNISSPKQLGDVLFEKLQLGGEKPKRTKTGQYQTGEDVLMKFAHTHAIVKEILDYRQLQKLKSTYVDALPALVNPRTGRVHTSYNQAVAATGRLSSTNPNLQNIPIRTDRGKEVRKAFIPRDENHLLLSADYSQIELRIVASISGDENMMDAFRSDKDIHRATAAKVYGISEDEVTSEQRRNAKSVNFGIIYGQQAFGLSENLGISRAEAKELIENYYATYPKIKGYMDNIINSAREKGYVETLLGRRRVLRDINSANGTVRSFAERVAINTPIQGTAADMIKIAMINIQRELKQSGLQGKMIMQVHDELVFDVPKGEAEQLKELVTKFMSEALPLDVPVLAEAGIGVNWLEAH